MHYPSIYLYLNSMLLGSKSRFAGTENTQEQEQGVDHGSRKSTFIECFGSDHSCQIFTSCQLSESRHESLSKSLCKPPTSSPSGFSDLNSPYLELRPLDSQPFPSLLQRKLNARSFFDFWRFTYSTALYISHPPQLLSVRSSASKVNLMHNPRNNTHTNPL